MYEYAVVVGTSHTTIRFRNSCYEFPISLPSLAISLVFSCRQNNLLNCIYPSILLNNNEIRCIWYRRYHKSLKFSQFFSHLFSCKSAHKICLCMRLNNKSEILRTFERNKDFFLCQNSPLNFNFHFVSSCHKYVIKYWLQSINSNSLTLNVSRIQSIPATKQKICMKKETTYTYMNKIYRNIYNFMIFRWCWWLVD